MDFNNNCVQTMLEALESVDSQVPVSESSEFRNLKVQLRFLRTFYVCGQKWGKDECCDILVSINRTVSHMLKFQSGDLILRDHLVSIQQSFRPEMEKVYLIFSDKSLRTSSSSPEVVELLLEIMDSLLHNFKDFLQHEAICGAPAAAVEDLEKNVKFLKNFILFVTYRGIQNCQMENLLTRSESLVLDAARFIFMSWYDLHFKEQFDLHYMWHNIYHLVETIRPVDPDVGKIYVGVLQEASALSQESLESPSESSQLPSARQWLVLQNFIDSLCILHKDLLDVRPSNKKISRHQMQKLLEELSFLRNILSKAISMKMLDRIGDVICQGGTIIFRLCLKEEYGGELAEKLEPLFSDVEKIKSILAQHNVLGSIDSVLEKIKSREADLGAWANDKVNNLHSDFTFLRSLLFNLMLQRNHNEKLPSEREALKNRVITVAQATGTVLDSPNSRSLVTQLEDIAENINQIKANEIPVSNEIVVGLDDATQWIINGLMRGAKTRDILSIVGMPGLGKTTLAEKVFNAPAITHDFAVRSWGHVSQNYKKESLLLEILHGAGYKILDEHFPENADDLASVLRRHLKERRYLIILDDVWDITVWNDLKISFPDDRNGSRLLLTSRHYHVPYQINKDIKPYHLRWLSNEESWEILLKKLGVEMGCTPPLLSLLKEIAQNCKGSPLMVKLVAGILLKKDVTIWEVVAKKLKEGTLSISEHCREILELSYSHLPANLKLCFLYFGAFQEYPRIPVRNLLWLWIAEELVKRTEGVCTEDVAEKYMKELIDRSLVMVSEKGSRGRAKSCVLHDLLLDFCRVKSKEEGFFYYSQKKHELGNSVDRSTLSKLRVYSRYVEDFQDSTLSAHLYNLFFVADYEKRYQQHRGIFSEVCQSEILRVLDLRQINKVPFFPIVFKLHKFLKYLAFRPFTPTIEGEFLTIPSSIENLSNLETFIVEGCEVRLLLPDSMWKMRKLRHLRISGSACLDFPKGSIEGQSNIETLSTIVFPCGHTMEKVIRKFPNIRRLKCRFFKAKAQPGDCKILALNFLSQLESLTVSQIQEEFHDLHFQFPRNLKKLVLTNFCLPWKKLSTFIKLPNLEVLKLLDNAFAGKKWVVKGNKFPKLRFLKLANLDLIEWTASDEEFSCLEKLVLESCLGLKKLPSFSGSIGTLEMIEVSVCKSATSEIKSIQKGHHEWGNQDLKVITDNIIADMAGLRL